MKLTVLKQTVEDRSAWRDYTGKKVAKTYCTIDIAKEEVTTGPCYSLLRLTS